jgi:hypothetical protein
MMRERGGSARENRFSHLFRVEKEEFGGKEEKEEKKKLIN